MKCRLPKKIGGGGVNIEYAANFADNDWATIIAVCQAGIIPETWTVGSQKTMLINGVNYPIDIIGIEHDEYVFTKKKAPFTFQMHDLYQTMYPMNSTDTSATGWWGSYLRNTTLPQLLAKMPAEVQAGVKEVKTLAGYSSTYSDINTHVDKLFLLSEVEVVGSISNSHEGEGTQYAYYANGNSKIKKLNGTASRWWLRSPRKSSTDTSFAIIHESGVATNSTASVSRGIAFAFCF